MMKEQTKQAKTKKTQLEQDIKSMIDSFENETGFTVEDVQVSDQVKVKAVMK